MAKISIENAEVTSVMKTGTGFRAQTQFNTRSGGTVTEKYVIWSDKKVSVGDVVNVDGLLTVKQEEFTNDKGEVIKYVAIHVNNPTVQHGQSGPSNPVETDNWLAANAKPLDEQAPF